MIRTQAERLSRRVDPVLSRGPRAEERAYLSAFLVRQESLYENDKAGAQKAAVDLCQLLICSNEFVYID